MWIEDNSPWGSFSKTRSIGWLDNEHPYPTGPVDESVYKKLIELFKKSHGLYATAGYYTCNLCQFEGMRGNGELYVPADGFLYICPKLITHYINIHWYQPPQDFCQVVMQCPPIHSMEYKKAFLNNGGRELIKKIKKMGEISK